LVSARQSVAFERCSFNQLGGAGLDIANGAQQNRVIGSRFFNVSGNGIQVGDVLAEDHHPSDPRSVAPVAQGVYLDEGSGYIEVTDNLIYGVSDPVHLNNYQGVRNGTCSIHDNFFDQSSDSDAGASQIAGDAGIQSEYRDILVNSD